MQARARIGFAPALCNLSHLLFVDTTSPVRWRPAPTGELEFPEFKAILRKAINGGGAGQDLVWREQPQQPGVWVGDLTAGSAVGEAAILDTSPQVSQWPVAAGLSRTQPTHKS